MPIFLFHFIFLLASIFFGTFAQATCDGVDHLVFPEQEFAGNKSLGAVSSLVKDPGELIEEFKNDQGKKVFRSWTHYDEAAQLVSVVFVGCYEHPINELASVYFGNFPEKHNWIDLTTDVQLLTTSKKKIINPNQYEWEDQEHVVGDHIVFFISARSFVTENKFVVNTKDKWMAFIGHSVDDKKAAELIPGLEQFNQKEDQVLGDIHFVFGAMESVDHDRSTLITLGLMADPKGLIPAPIVRLASRGWPLKTSTNLLAFVEQKHFEVVDFFNPAFEPASLQKPTATSH